MKMRIMKDKKLFLACLASFLLGMGFLFLIFLARPELAPRMAGAPRDPLSEVLEQDPFQQLESMHEQLAGFSGSMTLGGVGEQEIVEKEDEESFFYEISGIDQTKLSTRVEDGYIMIKGETKKSQGAGGMSATIQSTFQRTFPLPPNVDETKMEMSNDKDKVILRFPKRG